MNDLRFALRQLLKNPAFTIFSVVCGVLLKPLPFPEQEKLVFIREWSEQVPGELSRLARGATQFHRSCTR